MDHEETISPCCDGFVRAKVVDETCRVDISADGKIESTDDPIIDGVITDSLYCETCGEELVIDDIINHNFAKVA